MCDTRDGNILIKIAVLFHDVVGCRPIDVLYGIKSLRYSKSHLYSTSSDVCRLHEILNKESVDFMDKLIGFDTSDFKVILDVNFYIDVKYIVGLLVWRSIFDNDLFFETSKTDLTENSNLNGGFVNEFLYMISSFGLDTGFASGSVENRIDGEINDVNNEISAMNCSKG